MTDISYTRAPGKLKVYLCGGTGINIAVAIKKMLGSINKAGLADVELVLVDTSTANLNESNKGDNVYLFKGLDGGGKDRRYVYGVVSPKAFEVLDKHAPGDFNIVISSLGGGSGATLAPVLMRELIKQDKLAVAVGITNTDSKIELDNTLATMASYEGLADALNAAVVLAPFHNDSSQSHSHVNDLVANLVVLLAVLTSRQNAHLDSADVANWLRFDKTTKVEPRLMGLLHAIPTTELSDDITPLTVATLARQGEQVRPTWVPDYQAVGYLPTDCDVLADSPAHFVIADGVVQSIYDKLAIAAEELKRKATGRSLSRRLNASSATDDGMMF